MYKFNKEKAVELEPKTFKSLNIKEDDLEEMLRNSIDMLCGDEESMLIIGRQVMNVKRGRCDLCALDNEGNFVLIELKRDEKDITHRSEALEFQAIRYAASYAKFTDLDDLVQQVYAPYIRKYRQEFGESELTDYELGMRKIKTFLNDNGAINTFNKKQRIILAASKFDEQTLSAVSWLCANGVDISCYQLTPYVLNDEVYIKPERLLPITSYDSYYIGLMGSTEQAKSTKKITRQTLPKINELLEAGVVKAGDVIMPKDRTEEAILCDDGKVDLHGEHLSLQAWLKRVYGWSSVQTYMFAIHKERNMSLSALREEYMDAQGVESFDSDADTTD